MIIPTGFFVKASHFLITLVLLLVFVCKESYTVNAGKIVNDLLDKCR